MVRIQPSRYACYGGQVGGVLEAVYVEEQLHQHPSYIVTFAENYFDSDVRRLIWIWDYRKSDNLRSGRHQTAKSASPGQGPPAVGVDGPRIDRKMLREQDRWSDPALSQEMRIDEVHRILYGPVQIGGGT